MLGLSLTLVSTLTGLTIWLKLEQRQLTQQVSSLTMAKQAETDQVKRLQAQVNLLNQQVPKGLSNQLEETQAELKKLQNRTEEVNDKAVSSE